MSFHHFQNVASGIRPNLRYFNAPPAVTQDFNYGGVSSDQSSQAIATGAEGNFNGRDMNYNNQFVGEATFTGSPVTYPAATQPSNTPTQMGAQHAHLSSYIPVNYPPAYYRPMENLGYGAPTFVRAGYGNRAQSPMMIRPPRPMKGLVSDERPTLLPRTKTFYCEICSVRCDGVVPYQAHIKGQRHVKRANATACASPTPAKKKKEASSTEARFCQICKVHCSSASNLADHEAGSKHARMLKNVGKINEVIEATQMKGTPAKPSEPMAISSAATTVAATEADGAQNTIIGPVKPAETPCLNTKSLKNILDTYGTFIKTIIFQGKPTCFCLMCRCRVTDTGGVEAHVLGRRHRNNQAKRDKRVYRLQGAINQSPYRHANVGAFGVPGAPTYAVPLISPIPMDDQPPDGDMLATGSQLGTSMSDAPDELAFAEPRLKISQLCLQPLKFQLKPFIQQFYGHRIVDSLEKLRPDPVVEESIGALRAFLCNFFAKFGSSVGGWQPKFSSVQPTGPFVKNVALANDCEEELLVICSSSSGENFWTNINTYLAKDIQESAKNYTVDDTDKAHGSFVVRTVDAPLVEITVRIALPNAGDDDEQARKIEQYIRAETKRVIWFKQIHSTTFVDGVRMMRYLQQSADFFKALDEYAWEVLISHMLPYTCNGLKGTFIFCTLCEKMSCGLLLPHFGIELLDPCQPEANVNLLAKLSVVDRLAITVKFQELIIGIGTGILPQIFPLRDEELDAVPMSSEAVFTPPTLQHAAPAEGDAMKVE